MSGLDPMRDGFDAEVMLCPGHEWTLEDHLSSRLPDEPPPTESQRAFYLCVVCVYCRALRCEAEYGQLRCEEVVHHVLLPHRTADGTTWPIGSDPT